MINELEKHEANELENWYGFSLKKQKKFCKKLLLYANDNKAEFTIYVNSLTPKLDSSLSIVFEALSSYSEEWNKFLFIQLKRVVDFALQSEKSAESLELLSDLYLEKIYRSDYNLFRQILEHLISCLDQPASEKFRSLLVYEIETMLIEFEDEKDTDYIRWNEKIDSVKKEFSSSNMNDKLGSYAEALSTKLRIWPLIILSVGFFTCLGLGAFFWMKNNSAASDDLSNITAALVLFGLSVCIAYSVFRIEIYELDKAFLKIQSIFGKDKKIIRRNDIERYVLLEKESKYEKWKELVIFTTEGSHKLYSSYMHSYDFNRLRADLIHGVKKSKAKEEFIERRSSRRVGKWIAIVCFSIVTLMLYLNMNSEDQAIKASELTKVKGTITNELKIERKKSSRWIDIKLEEYPEIVFKVSGFNFKASAKEEILDYFKPGSEAELYVKTEDFKTKISGSTPRSFKEKVFYSQNIQVYELYQGEWSYVFLEEANQLRVENVTGWWYWLIIIFFGTLGAFGIKMMLFFTRKSARS